MDSDPLYQPKSVINQAGQLWRLHEDGNYLLDDKAPILKYGSSIDWQTAITVDGDIYMIEEDRILNLDYKIARVNSIYSSCIYAITQCRRFIVITVDHSGQLQVTRNTDGVHFIIDQHEHEIAVLSRDGYWLSQNWDHHGYACGYWRLDQPREDKPIISSGLLTVITEDEVYSLKCIGISRFQKVTYCRLDQPIIIGACELGDSILALHVDGHLYNLSPGTDISTQSRVYSHLSDQVPFRDMLVINHQTYLIDQLGKSYVIRRIGLGCEIEETDIPEYIFQVNNVKNARTG